MATFNPTGFSYRNSLSANSPASTVFREYTWDVRFNGYRGDVAVVGLSAGAVDHTILPSGVRPFTFMPANTYGLTSSASEITGVIDSFTYVDINNIKLVDVPTFEKSNLLAGTKVKVKIIADPYAVYSVQVFAPNGLGYVPEGIVFEKAYNSTLLQQDTILMRDNTTTATYEYFGAHNNQSTAHVFVPAGDLSTMLPYTLLADTGYFVNGIAVGEGFDVTYGNQDETTPHPYILCRLLGKYASFSVEYWSLTFPTV